MSAEGREGAGLVRIKNTLTLGEVQVSEAYADELRQRPDLEVLGDPVPLAFDAAGQLIPC